MSIRVAAVDAFMASSEALFRPFGQIAAESLQIRRNSEDPSATPATLGPMPNDLHPQLDATDRAILEALSEDARMPNSKLAERVGVAPSTALARVRALRAAGVLLGFHAEVDLAALGRPLQAMVAVRLAVHNREQIDTFTRAVRDLPGVLTVFHLAGATDYLVWLAAADAQDLREFVVDHLATHPAVAHAETSLIYESRRGPGIWGAAEPGSRR
jgi:DNA-binding Lrp family transcriptional regulator